MASSLTRAAPLVGSLGALCAVSAHGAGTIDIDDTRWVSVGAGIRAGMSLVDDGAPSGEDDSTSFDIQNLRLYVSGQAHENVRFVFNTECSSCVFGTGDPFDGGKDIDVLDAIAQIELSPAFNVWIGRMLTPADRIEMNGPFYGLSWNQYTVPLLPSDQFGQAGLMGRDDGVTVWGKVGRFQYSLGLFDGIDGGPNQDDNLLYASRFAFNFGDMEINPGYYTSSTYFGEAGKILTLGLSFQQQSDGTGTAAQPGDFSATIVDFLYEQPLGRGAAVTFEAEYKTFDAELTPAALADPTCFCLFDGDAYFATFAYLLPGTGGSDSLSAVRALHEERADRRARQQPDRGRRELRDPRAQRAPQPELHERRRERVRLPRRGHGQALLRRANPDLIQVDEFSWREG